MGKTLGKSHYKFAGELVAEILLPSIPEGQRQAELHRKFQTIAELLPVFELTDIILTIYAKSRNLAD